MISLPALAFSPISLSGASLGSSLGGSLGGSIVGSLGDLFSKTLGGSLGGSLGCVVGKWVRASPTRNRPWLSLSVRSFPNLVCLSIGKTSGNLLLPPVPSSLGRRQECH